jgi:hypothetical protein
LLFLFSFFSFVVPLLIFLVLLFIFTVVVADVLCAAAK